MKKNILQYRIFLKLVTLLLLGSATQVKADGLDRYYTLPCGPNNNTIIPIISLSAKPPYTLFAADATTIIAGPQTSHVFQNIAGMPGDNFVISVIDKFTNNPVFTTITLNSGTTTIYCFIYCVCTLGNSPICYAVPESDSITGASYIWTSPGGIHYYQSHPYVGLQPPENGIWNLNASFTFSGCNYILTNTFVLSNCFSPGLPIKYNYVRAGSNNCHIKVEWSTAQENNSDRFELESSENEMTGWQKVATVTAAGNSSTDILYNSIIPAGAATILYIRLKQIDRDGHFTYSIVLKVNTVCNTRIDMLTVTPGIIQRNGTLSVKLESNTDRGRSYIILFDAEGRQYFKKVVPVNKSINQYTVPAINFPDGTYFIKLMGATGSWQSNTVRFIIQ